MITERTNAKGEKVIVVRLTKKRKDGTPDRYRRDAAIQTMKGAKEEEQSLLRHWFEFGTFEPAAAEPAPKVHTWEDALKHYKEHGLRQLKTTSRKGYLEMYGGKRFERWAGFDVTKIDSAEINKWQQEILDLGPLKPGVVGISKSLMHVHRCALLAVLANVGPLPDGAPGVMLAKLPVFPDMPKNLRRDKEVKAPTDVTLKKILAAAKPELRLGFSIAAYSGLRAGEIRALTKRQVNLDEGYFLIDQAKSHGIVSTTKSGRERTIPIDRRLVPLLKERLARLDQDTDHVCVSTNGEPLTEQVLTVALRRLCKKLGITGVRLHGLRHYRGTSLYKASKNIKTVQKSLGHALVQTTMRYITVEYEDMKKASDEAAGLDDSDMAAE